MKIPHLIKNPIQLASLKFGLELAAQKGITLEYEALELGNDAEVFNLINSLIRKNDPELKFIRMDLDLSQYFLQQYSRGASDVMQIQCADTLVLQDGAWWPRLFFRDAIFSQLMGKGKNLNFRESAYIVGDGAMLRLLVSFIVQIGFSKIHLVSEDLPNMKEQIAFLKTKFLGVDFLLLDIESLTLQTVGANILINSYDLSQRSGLATDLAYFNFMSKDSLVVDLGTMDANSPLLEEARSAKLRYVDPADIYRCWEQMYF